MTGRGRPPIGQPVKIRLDPEMRAKVEEFAKATGIKPARATRILMAAGLGYGTIEELLATLP